MRSGARSGRLAALLVAAGCAHGAPSGSAPPPPAPAAAARGLSIKSQQRYYDVAGSTVAELRASVRQLGPGEEGQERDALTVWDVAWTYGTGRPADRCALRDVQVTLTVTVTLPRWRHPADASPPLIAAWNSYVAHVEVHEAGHRAIAEQYARRLVAALTALRGDPCDKVWDAAGRTAARVVAEGRAKNREYDVATNHGQTQGVILSP
jgi:predicted secreted Zn-dependent protease